MRDIEADDLYEVIVDNLRIPTNHASGDRRRNITQAFRDAGVRRPPVLDGTH